MVMRLVDAGQPKKNHILKRESYLGGNGATGLATVDQHGPKLDLDPNNWQPTHPRNDVQDHCPD